MKPLDIISGFVKGDVSPSEFELALYKDKDLEGFLSKNIPFPPYVDKNELYYFLIEKNYKSFGDLWDVQELLSQFLTYHGINVEKTSKYKDLVKLIMKVQPKWLDIPGDYVEYLISLSGRNEGKELEEFLRNKIKDNFKSLKKTPKWLQSPNWPIENYQPFTFVGQIDISDLKHDTSYVYLFLNEKTGSYVTIEQSM
ncbi:TPA: hypothetical protein SLN72_002832 [Morganella morganii]|nr:hypothetical protein [Morganella morganii]